MGTPESRVTWQSREDARVGFLKRLLGGGSDDQLSSDAAAADDSGKGFAFPPPSLAAPKRPPGPNLHDLRPAWMVNGVAATLYSGGETLEVVGESYRQEGLWGVVGQRPTNQRVHHEAVALLVPETGNPYDANAIAVWIAGHHVGYLSRDDAAAYRPGVERLAVSAPVALNAVVVGGGFGNGVAILGAFLDHDPTDFGLSPTRYRPSTGELRTGLSQAFQTDELDDSYDLSWLNDLPQDTRRAITQLRTLLISDPDLIDRHFMFSELEARLYKLRDVEDAALAEFDDACAQHDSEMDRIRTALHQKFGAVPLLEMYKQQCVRQQKAKDFERGLWWAERGLALYGTDAYSQDWTDDLKKRLAWFRMKLDSPSPAAPRPRTSPKSVEMTLVVENLTCTRCGCIWERTRVRGRKPLLCPSCAADA